MIVSIDVGLKNLGLCILEEAPNLNNTQEGTGISIVYWNVFNLAQTNSIQCCHENCNHPAVFSYNTNVYCRTHAKQQCVQIGRAHV